MAPITTAGVVTRILTAIFLSVLSICTFFIIKTFVLQYAWNYIMPSIFGVQPLNLYQSFFIVLMIEVIIFYRFGEKFKK